MLCFCFKCKKKTKTIHVVPRLHKKNQYILKGICCDCGCKKSTFMKKDDLKNVEYDVSQEI